LQPFGIVRTIGQYKIGFKSFQKHRFTHHIKPSLVNILAILFVFMYI
jgi:hypothetical protein